MTLTLTTQELRELVGDGTLPADVAHRPIVTIGGAGPKLPAVPMPGDGLESESESKSDSPWLGGTWDTASHRPCNHSPFGGSHGKLYGKEAES